MNGKSLTKNLTQIVRRVRKGYAGSINAERDWFLILAIAGIGILASGVMNAISFTHVYDGKPISRETNTNPPARETKALEERLESINTFFMERSEAHQAAQQSAYPFVDPARN